jgi:polyhydroxybutyrate depolymerase
VKAFNVHTRYPGGKKILNLNMKRKLLFSLLFSLSLVANSQTTVIDSIMSGGIYRNYRLYIPAAYNGTSAWPLVLNLHGYTSNASAQQAYTGFGVIADTAHFLMVYPNGTTYMGQPYWNSWGAGVDDIGFLSDLIVHLDATYNVDNNRVYSCGMSNGGFMSFSLACGLSSKIAAIASVTGSMSTYTKSVCAPSHPVPVMEIHGTADGTVAYTGASTYLAIDSVVKYWRVFNNCNPTAVFNNVPNINTSDGCTAEHYVYNGGSNGSSVELYKIIGGGHTWPFTFPIGVTNQDFNASEKIWLFFRKYRLNQLVGINEQENISNVTIYPNPASNSITVEAENISIIEIFDLDGSLIVRSDKKQIDVSDLAKGVYSVVIISPKGRSVKKLIKL